MINFYSNVEKIKHIERNGWKKIGVKGIIDTIASHSYGAQYFGWILAINEGKNSSKIIKMLLIHDLIMAHIDNLTPHQKQYKNKRELENKAAEKLFKTLPEEISTEFKILFNEYQEEKTEEAQLAREADKLETLYQAYFYSKKLKRNELQQFVDSYKHKIKSKTGKELLAKIQ